MTNERAETESGPCWLLPYWIPDYAGMTERGRHVCHGLLAMTNERAGAESGFCCIAITGI
jgi:hypothetical protein